jgi:hypothetical protein
MKEKIYTIPVNEAFDSDCECPICYMERALEKDAVEYVMGPSYMEDIIREQTDRLGFCEKHMKQVYDIENRLGFALVMKTHLDKVIGDIEKISQQPSKGKKMFKKIGEPPVCSYVDQLNSSCYVCDKIRNTFDRYMDTILVLYEKEPEFKQKYEGCKGFCTKHYSQLLLCASKRFHGDELDNFVLVTNTLYLENMKRVRDDVAWFINKFDHKYVDEPWKNAKDSLTRAMIKDNSILPD